MDYLLPNQVALAARELAALPGIEVQDLGRGALAGRLPVLRVAGGPSHIAVKANAHADEPAGTVTCLTFARRLLADPALAVLRRQATFHLLPTANPAGLARNAGWLHGPPGDLTTWFEHVDRDPPAADREFGYGDTPAAAAHPECGAWHAYLNALPRLDGYLSLHSMAFAGGAWHLVMLDNPPRHQPLLADLAAAAAARGLPLHDEDRGGRKGFHRLAPGFCTAPTREEMAAFFAADPTAAGWLRLNSLQVVRRRHGTPVALVSELPQWWHEDLADLTPADQLRSTVDRRTGDRLAATLAELAETLATAPGDSPAAHLAASELAHRQATAAALTRLASDWGEARAARRDLAAEALQYLRARATNAALAVRLAAADGRPVAALRAALQERVGEIEARWRWRPLPLEEQVALQQTMIVAVTRHVTGAGSD